MTDAQLYRDLTSLPDSLKQEAGDFIAFLKQKTLLKEKGKKSRPLGLAKGKIVIKDNFDDPISGFEGYQ